MLGTLVSSGYAKAGKYLPALEQFLGQQEGLLRVAGREDCRYRGMHDSYLRLGGPRSVADEQ